MWSVSPSSLCQSTPTYLMKRSSPSSPDCFTMCPSSSSSGCLSHCGESVQCWSVSAKETAMECQKGRQRRNREKVIEFRCWERSGALWSFCGIVYELLILFIKYCKVRFKETGYVLARKLFFFATKNVDLPELKHSFSFWIWHLGNERWKSWIGFIQFLFFLFSLWYAFVTRHWDKNRPYIQWGPNIWGPPTKMFVLQF